MAAAGHVAQLPPDSQCDECRSPTPWCFPLAPEGSPQSQADPASESNQFLGRLAKAEIAASRSFNCGSQRSQATLNSANASTEFDGAGVLPNTPRFTLPHHGAAAKGKADVGVSRTGIM
jgi:hypothetical protein